MGKKSAGRGRWWRRLKIVPIKGRGREDGDQSQDGSKKGGYGDEGGKE